MFKIGLTGGIASGKSTVLNYFKDRGIPYIDADVVARDVVNPGTPGLASIVEYFGIGVLNTDGTLNREALGSIVFHNEEKRRILDSCLTEHIRHQIMELTHVYETQCTPVLMYDIPLLIEGEWYSMMDTVWLVYVNEDTQMHRLMHRNQYSKEDALARIHSQMKLDDKRTYANTIIDNNGTPYELEEQLAFIWKNQVEPLLITNK